MAIMEMEVPIRNDDQCMTAAAPSSAAPSKEAEAMSTNPTAESRQPGFWRDMAVIIAIATVIIAIFSLAVMGFTSLDSKIDAQRAELKQDNAELRAELKRDNAELRADLRQDNADLRAELRQDNADLRAELRQDNAEFRRVIDAQNAELRKIVTDTGDKFERLYSALLTQQAPQ